MVNMHAHRLLVLCILVLSIVVALWVVSRGKPAGAHPTAACAVHLADLHDALERYSKEHRGCYPRSLGDLVPAYFDTLPRCPFCACDAYSPGYELHGTSDYTLYCIEGRRCFESGLNDYYDVYSRTGRMRNSTR